MCFNKWNIVCSMLYLSKNWLNSLLENSLPLSLWIILCLLCVVKQLFRALITVIDFLLGIHLAHAYLEKWSIIINKYLNGLVVKILASCTKSIWHLSNGLLLLIWWTISPFLNFPALIWHISHLYQKVLTSEYMQSHLNPEAFISSQIGSILRWLPCSVW